MIANKPYIIYSLPQSRTTQSLIGGKIEKVWANVKHFLTACTNSIIEKPDRISLVCYSADEKHGENPEAAGEILKRTQALFGVGATSPLAYHYPSNILTTQTKTEWSLSFKDLDTAIDYIIKGQPYPKHNLGPIELILSYDFKLVDPISKVELPDQQFPSSILVWLTKSNCVSPSLCFPFTEPNQEFWEFVSKIESFLPFKFEKKYLRLGRANKKGTANMFSKIKITTAANQS